MENKYELVIKYIEKLVEDNKMKQGDRLPSIKSLSEKFKFSKSTIIRAYDELEKNHKIYSIPKSGYYLVEQNNSINDECSDIDFETVIPDPKLLPYKEFNHCVNKAIELYQEKLFLYNEPQGLDSLRKILVSHFSEYQIFTKEEKIFITSGAQQALSILSRMTFPNSKKNILVEQPTYTLIHTLVELNGDKLIGINRNYEGINFDELENIFMNENIKFFYTIPRFHNPLGTSYSERDKQKIVGLAQKYDVYVVEDDYLADIDKNKKSLPMYYYDVSEKVIYVKSFSKTFMPGIRIGAVVVPNVLREEFIKHKRCYDLNTSVLSQGALEIFINSGMYNNHIKKAKLKYIKKMEFLKEILKNIDTEDIEFFIPEIGFFLWIKIPNEINIDILMHRLKEKNVYISLPKNFFLKSNIKENSFRICISRLNKNEIKKGIEILFKTINELKNKR